jgi:crotonobetainyl-CoA:carnitine CoA-transferase CaiB-like acyl-CoA transferase
MANAVLETFTSALGAAPVDVAFTGEPTLTSAFAVSDFAAAAIATAGVAVSGIAGDPTRVTVDRGLVDAWFASAITPVGWQIPSPWDAVAGDYRCADGWIRLHTNAPRHKAAALGVLGVAADRELVAEEVAGWSAEELEAAVVAAGGCAAVMRSAAEWAAHPQGAAVASEPLVHWTTTDAAAAPRWRPSPGRPLDGLRVLDLTRVIAGPVATRFLAGLGADVLRVDPPDWHEPAVVPDMTLGKRAARIDATTTVGRDALERLIADADLLVHGYRPGALEKLVPLERRRALRPGLVEVSLDAYGWSGPWAGRRGFDSLVQMSSGIAEAGMRWADASKPTPLPVQALDHATGYLAAAAAVVALGRVRREGVASTARVSLARTAVELVAAVPEPVEGPPSERALRQAQRQESTRIDTPWGPADVLPSPLTVGDIRLNWQRGPTELGSDEPRW